MTEATSVKSQESPTGWGGLTSEQINQIARLDTLLALGDVHEATFFLRDIKENPITCHMETCLKPRKKTLQKLKLADLCASGTLKPPVPESDSESHSRETKPDEADVPSVYPFSSESLRNLVLKLEDLGYEVVFDSDIHRVRPRDWVWLIGSKKFSDEEFVESVVKLIEDDALGEEYTCKMRNVKRRVIIYCAYGIFDVCVKTYSDPGDIVDVLNACQVPTTVSKSVMDDRQCTKIDDTLTLVCTIRSILNQIEKQFAERLLALGSTEKLSLTPEIRINMYGDYYAVDFVPEDDAGANEPQTLQETSEEMQTPSSLSDSIKTWVRVGHSLTCTNNSCVFYLAKPTWDGPLLRLAKQFNNVVTPLYQYPTEEEAMAAFDLLSEELGAIKLCD